MSQPLSSVDQADLLAKQAALVQKLASVATAQQRILAFMNADFQDFDASPALERTGYDSENEADIAEVDATVTTAAATLRLAVQPDVAEDARPDIAWDEDEVKALKDYERDWTSHLVPPSGYTRDQTENADGAPSTQLALDHVYGYRSRGCRDNIALADEDTLVYHAAGVGIVESISNNRQRHFRGHDDEIVCLAYNPTRRIVATGQIGQRAKVCVWRVDDPAAAPLLVIPFAFGVAAVAITDDGSHIVGVDLDADHCVLVVNLNTGLEVARQTTGSNRIIDVTWAKANSDANALSFTTVGARHITFWRLTLGDGSPDLEHTPAALGRLGELQTFSSVAATPAAIYVGCDSGSLYVFMDNKLIRSIDAHSGPIYSMNIRASRNEILTGGRDGFLCVWEADTLKQVTTLDLNPADKCQGANSVKAIAVNPSDDGPTPSIVAGTAAGSVYKFNGPTYKRSTVVANHYGDLQQREADSHIITALAVHPTQLTAASGGSDCSLRVWDLKRHKMTNRVDFRHPVTCCTYSKDGSKIAVGFGNGSVCLVNSKNLFTIHSTRKSLKRVGCLDFSPDGSHVAAGFEDGCLRLFKVDGPESDSLQLTGVHNVGGEVMHLDWSVDSSVLRINLAGLSVAYLDPISGSSLDAFAVRDVLYQTHTCPLSWETQGVWPMQPKGAEILSVVASNAHEAAQPSIVASAEASGNIKLFKYPCLGSGVDRKAKTLTRRPHSHAQLAHGPGVSEVKISFDNTTLISTGGTDACVFQWTLVN